MSKVINAEKANNFARLKDLFKFARKYYVPMVISIILLIGSAILSILTPRYVQTLTNLISPAMLDVGANGMVQVKMDLFTQNAITLLIFIVVSFVLSMISGMVFNVAVQKLSRDIRTSISEKTNKMPLNYFDTKQIGDILSVITNDVDALSTSLQNSITLAVQAVVTLVGVIIAMFISEWHMALVVLISLPIILIAIFVIFRFATPMFAKNQNLLGEVNAEVEESFTGQIVIKAFGAEERKNAQFRQRNGALGKTLYVSQALGGIIEPVMSVLSYLTYAAIMIVGGILYTNNQIELGLITGFLVYVSLFQQPLSEIGQIGSTVQLGIAAAGRVFDFLAEEELPDESEKKKGLLDHANIRGEVEFRHVAFGYDPTKLTIKDFNQKIKPGMKVAIIGPTGAGKTTLVNLLMRFYETTKGDILVDGVSIHDMTREELRTVFGMILQETWVINGTLRENIVYNLKNVSEDRLNEILKETSLDHFVSTLPQGIDTVIQKDSALSAGQKQLVTIARAMAENSPMLILDEATSNVDTRTEILIQSAMDSLTKGRTSFVIAHRLSTIKNADLIIVMKAGDVVETGTHDSLMALGGLYSEIYNSQFNN
ncbi:MAG: ABC transporter ATP-binding protein [Bacilli bacterium]|nr:ABC transporter ATP-binding protein [Bacilli bacterium]MBO6284874.1 ABC transporter ATP-binding protein [Bacilli bacterium]